MVRVRYLVPVPVPDTGGKRLEELLVLLSSRFSKLILIYRSIKIVQCQGSKII
jgi:hypothetical protein